MAGFVLCLVFFTPGLFFAALAGELARVEALQARALQLKLHEQRYWQVLLHYRKHGERWISLIDDPGFFLSPQGKTDPDAELLATIAALFGSPGTDRNSPRCRFAARYAWLCEKLGIAAAAEDSGRGCREFADTLRRVAPRSATLVFPGSYPNSPASMFGHTLLNFDGPYQSKQLSHAANYSAHTDESNGFAYAIKGVTGGYRGYFSLLPYYEKIKEYSGLEHRDVWEYPLRLTADEVRKMFFHLWELGGIYSDYYFFDENCSYNLLFLLEAARPDLNLTEDRSLWVMPIDTVRLVDRKGLISSASYRPSVATLLDIATTRLTKQEIQAVHDLVAGRLDAEDLELKGDIRESRIRVLETAAQVIELRFIRREIDLHEYRKRYLRLLSARSRLGSSVAPVIHTQVPSRPDHGHGTSRFGVGVGYADSRWVQEVRYRPVYHSLPDAEDGYLPGSQIVLGELALRLNERRKKIQLQHFQLINIVSLSPVNAFNAPVSWQVKLGLRQVRLSRKQSELTAYVNPAGGYAMQGDRGLGYLLLETEGLVAKHLQDNVAAGIGVGGGLITQFGNDWRLHLNFRQMNYLVGERDQNFALRIDQNLRLDRNNSLSLEMSRQREFGGWYIEGLLFWNHYW